ncbi:peptidoglycan editing factor PgeF [Rhodocytophaga aerolata]|uniref:Purine nucleoside phosphorylase n=1 Tax=Rhodocytophaga aerolata TaxID=455078 RepID=A0ABT8R7K0_9BACT|nr:peptidoglycan editing factor PgeF [Rhodocytophaga aerolata]MDO1447934.1 peptidoglycan editing factor PgeF [Rhodocytophaga aerolata]
MIQQTTDSLKLWQFHNLSQHKGIKHFISGRSGGVSEGEIGSLNLSFRAGDTRENVQENRSRLAYALGISPEQLFFPAQTHSIHVKKVEPGTQSASLTDTDALVTNSPGQCICVMSADCVPILLYDPVKEAVGAVHAGWRGTVGKIVTATVQAMQQEFGTKPADLIAGIGPSICPEVYQIGEEVIEAVLQTFGKEANLISNQNGEGKGYFNLWEANRIQLLNLGVQPTSIEVAGICTYQQSDQFFSARKSGNRAGRFAAGILICPE